MEEWKEYKLGEIAEFRTGKLNSNASVQNGKFPFFTCAPETYYINDYAFDQKAILLAGNNAEGNFNIKYYEGKFNAYQRTYIINPVSDAIDIHFLYYALQLCLQQFKLLSQGTSTKFLTAKILNAFCIQVPSLSIQKRIADVIKSLDDKIEVNRKINENLEQQAQALFKSWFVDFEPFKNGEFVESELGMIPKGWRVGTLDEIADISKLSINPQKQPNTIFEHYSIPSFDDGMIPEKQLGEDIKSNKFIIKNKMTLFSKLNPRIKRVWYVDNVSTNSICSTEFVPYIAKEENLSSFVYCLINSQGFYDFVMSMVNGATGSHQRFHPEESMKFKMPYNDMYAVKYSFFAVPIINRILNNRDESRRLAELRDTLLPKLMSGELKVNEVENIA